MESKQRVAWRFGVDGRTGLGPWMAWNDALARNGRIGILCKAAVDRALEIGWVAGERGRWMGICARIGISNETMGRICDST